jgi:diguanylate cyclase (GGDEF)-like protein/PAS domain S-box-containing protein
MNSNNELTLAHIMSTHGQALPPDAPLAEAIRHMSERRCDHVVVQDGDRTVGIVAEHDLPGLLAGRIDADRLTLAAALREPPRTVSVGESVAAAAERMAIEQVRHLVVLDEAGRTLGVVSRNRLQERLAGIALDRVREPRDAARSGRCHSELLLRVEHHFARLLAAGPNRDAMLAAILEAALSLPELDAGGVLLREDDGGYRLARQHGLPDAVAGQLAALVPGSIPATTLDDGRLVCSCRQPTPICTRSDLFHSHVGDASGIRAIAILPIRVDGRPRACLYLVSRQTDSLDLDTVTALDTLAYQFSQAMARLAALEQAAEQEAALRGSEALLRTLVRSIPDLVWLKDPDGVYLACNPTFERLYGQPASRIIGRTDHDFVDRDQAEAFRAHDLAALSADQPRTNEEWLTFAGDGYRGLFETVKTAVRDSDGRLVGVLGIARDITERRRAELELKSLNRDFVTFLENTTDFVYFKDEQGRFRFCSQTMARITGHASWRDLVGKHDLDVFPSEMAHIYFEEERPVFREGRPLLDKIAPFYDEQGRKGWISTNKWPVFDAGGRVVGLFGISRDIGERMAAEAALKASEEMLRTLIDAMPDIVCFKDGEGRWLLANQFDLGLFQLDGVDYRGKTDSELAAFSPYYHDAFLACEATDEAAWRVGGPSRADEVIPRPDGSEMVFDVIKLPTFHADGSRKGLVVVGRDITERKRAEEQLRHLANFDPLTQLPNRILLSDRLRIATGRARRTGKLLAVCYLDLDGFKPINDDHGHATGDRLLVEVANRLNGVLRADDSVGRLGGDEFVLLLGDLDDEEQCRLALARVLEALARPFRIGGLSLTLSASIGVTLYPSDATDSDTLLRHADQAMYEAKEAGRNRYHFFDPERDQRLRSVREAHARIRQGLRDGEMVLHYQPRVNMRHGTVVGAEALIRWQHPERGLLPPGEFLPQVGDSDVALEIDQWVLEQALGQAAAWQRAGLDLTVSVNLTARTLGLSDLPVRLAALLEPCPGLRPESLELEILESVALEDVNRVAAIIDACRRHGVSFALDDFGTGYSSLLYLRHLPASVLKIDQSFVRDMLDDPGDLAIVEGIVGLAEAFQRKVVAEGVENEEVGALLLQLGCEQAQGYGIARPMPAAELPGWIAGYAPPASWGAFHELRGAHPDAPLLLMAIEHKRWVNRLLAMIDSRDASEMTRSGLELHARECRFGRWYYGPGRSRYGHTPAFHSLENAHSAIHRLGSELIELCLGGHQDVAQHRREELLGQRDSLLAAMERLRQH